MELVLQRSPSVHGFTLGALLIEGVHECWTCEDEVREVPGVPVEQWKVPGKTAIPSGRYRVIIDFSKRFSRLLPLLLCVPGFGGIRIHPGNDADDTDGCILPGSIRLSTGVAQSRLAFEALFRKIQAGIQGAGEVWIEVRNPCEVVS
ncbi:MAG: hypothetical protein JWN34_2024 [Bryobacterales bacterium]|nr:hypothetical protein [Bryobacterales bacterium]